MTDARADDERSATERRKDAATRPDELMPAAA